MTCRARTLRAAAAACCLSFAALMAGCTSTTGGPAKPSYSGPFASASESSVRPSDGGVPSSSSAGAAGEWLTYNGGNSRQGVATDELGTTGGTAGSSASAGSGSATGLASGFATGLASGSATGSSSAPVSVAWRARLDGAVYGQPLLLGGTVLAATENDTVYALDQSDGRVLWHSHLGTPQPSSALPCGDIDPLGITSTMAVDPVTGSLFALAETDGGHHVLFALDPADGAVRWQRPVESPAGTAIDTQQRSALTVAFGRVYVPFGGLFGDCGDYIGSVVGTPTSGVGTQIGYRVPTTRQGGIWAPGGLLTVGTTLYAAVGNGASSTGFDGSDSVIALSPDLFRLDYFAPTTWAQDNAADLDLGSFTPALVGGRILAVGKRGTAYLLAADRLGGVGGQLAQAQVCPAFGTGAVRGDTVYVPCPDGVRALEVTANSIRVLWKSAAADGSPTLSGGYVWTVDLRAGTLYRLDASTGAVTAQVALGPVPHFASPTLGASRAYVGTMNGVTAVTR